MKKIAVLVTMFVTTVTFAQLDGVASEVEKTIVEEPSDTIEGWRKSGTFSLLLNQSAFSNWIAGGSNSVAGNAGINYDFNYRKGDWQWDNKVILAYGISNIEGEGTRKTDDRIELNSIVSKKAFGNWRYSFFANFKTQFSNGYDYDLDKDNDYPTSGFMKPGYLIFGPGMMWKKSDNLKFNLAPLTSKMTYLGGTIYQQNDDGDWVTNDNVEMFGVEPGKSLEYELGFYASGYYKVNLMENVSMENILSLYSNYLDKPQNVDLDYTMNLVMQVNKYISTNLTFQTIYDDDAYSGFQIREVFGLGFNFNF